MAGRQPRRPCFSTSAFYHNLAILAPGEIGRKFLVVSDSAPGALYTAPAPLVAAGSLLAAGIWTHTDVKGIREV